MRLYTSAAFAFCIVLGGCSTETERGSEPDVEVTAPTQETEEAPAFSEPPRARISTPASDDTAANPVVEPVETPSEPITTGTEVVTSSTTSSVAAGSASVPVSPQVEILPQPSSYPVEMARTVELRKQLQQVTPESGALSDEQATTLERFARHMYTVAQSDNQLPSDQRKDLEDLAGKVQYQAEAMREGSADTTFANRLEGVKRLMESMQSAIATQEQPTP